MILVNRKVLFIVDEWMIHLAVLSIKISAGYKNPAIVFDVQLSPISAANNPDRLFSPVMKDLIPATANPSSHGLARLVFSCFLERMRRVTL